VTDLTALTATTTPLVTDIAYIVVDPAATKLPRKVIWGDIANLFRTIIETITGKSISLTDNTLTGTKAQFDTACTDDNFVYSSEGVLVSGGALGTPSSGTLTNCLGLPVAGLVAVTASRVLESDVSGNVSASAITSTTLSYLDATSSIQTQIDSKGTGNGDAIVANPLSQFAQTTSLQLKNTISDETGSGKAVFADSPVMDSVSLSYAMNAKVLDYTFELLDAGKVITSDKATAIVMTIPPNSSVAYPIGSSITVVSIGAGLTNFAIGSGVTINSTGAVPAAPVLRVQYSSATAIKTATDTWVVVGDIS